MNALDSVRQAREELAKIWPAGTTCSHVHAAQAFQHLDDALAVLVGEQDTTEVIPEAQDLEARIEKAELVLERYLDALKKRGVLMPFCDAHDRDHVLVAQDGEEYCSECAADGASGELCHLASDSDAISLTREIADILTKDTP